jgi:hypothetical protein
MLASRSAAACSHETLDTENHAQRRASVLESAPNPYGHTMNTKQAKDFLVKQAATQAAIENIPLTDIEKRMMYFTECDPASCPDPFALNDEFEAKFETSAYETKLSQLLEHARQRLRNDDPERTRNWEEAVRELQKDDHYILILLNVNLTASIKRPKHDFLKLIGAALLVVAGIALVALASAKFTFEFSYWIRPLLFVLVLAWAIFSRSGRQLLAAVFTRRKPR